MSLNDLSAEGKDAPWGRFLRVASLFAFALISLCFATALGLAQVPSNAKQQQSAGPIPVLEALQRGLIELEIEGGEKAVRVKIRRDSKDDDLKILFPAGMTKLGFIEGGTIKTGGSGAKSTFTSSGAEFSMFSSIKTNGFTGEGFSVEMKQDVLITLEKGKGDASISADGSLNLSVPFGYTGFFLAGLSGTITQGTIVIKRNSAADEEKFIIEYGNMKIKK